MRSRLGAWRVVVLVTALAITLLPPVNAVAEQPVRLCSETLVPMSDGVRLHGWVSRMSPEQPRPTLLMIHSYHTAACPTIALASTHRISRELTDQFTLVGVDYRGTGASEGEFDGTGPRSQQDFREVIQWVRSQPWSNGIIVLHGFSGGAFHAVHSIQEPGVVAAIFGSTCADMYRCFRRGGAYSTTGDLYTALTEWRFDYGPTRDRMGTGDNPPIPQQLAAIQQTQAQWIARDAYDDFAAERSGLGLLPEAKIPILYLTDPYDIVQNFDAYQLSAAAAQRGTAPAPRLSLGVGHTTQYRGQHYGRTQELIGSDIDRFVAQYGLGQNLGLENEPPVQVVVNRGSLAAYDRGNVTVRDEEAWPLPDTAWTPLYLEAGPTGSATSLNDGALALDAPSGSGVDPLALVPSANPQGGDLRLLAAADRSSIDSTVISDQRLVERTALTYTTPPLVQDVEVTGPAVVRLFATTALPDFDWVIRVTDVWPDGRSEWISDGYLRASLRDVDTGKSLRDGAGAIVRPWHTFAEKDQVPAGEVVEYLVTVIEMSNVFQAGHRIRLDILATGSGTDAARTAGLGPVLVHRDAINASSLLLPVIPGRCQLGTPLLSQAAPWDTCAESLAAALG